MSNVLHGDESYETALSALEHGVLELLADGYQSKEIGAKLARSTATIEGSIRTLFVKLRARSRAHLVTRAFELGLLTIHEHTEGDK